MNCQSIRAHLVDQWEELQDGFRDRDVQQHLDACDGCRRVAGEYAQSRRWLEELPQEEPAENFEWRLRLRLNQIDKEGIDPRPELVATSSAGRRSASIPFIGSAVAAAAVVLAVGIVSLRPSASVLPGTEVGSSAVVAESQPVPDATPSAPAGVHLVQAADHPGLPNLAPTRPAYLKVVPVSAGVPLGPESQRPPAPSILGEDILRLPAPLPR